MLVQYLTRGKVTHFHSQRCIRQEELQLHATYHMAIDGLVYLMVEVQSDDAEGDRSRMLLQAACMARLWRHMFKQPFIFFALYIQNSGQVTRYFVFQSNGDGDKVFYVADEQDWTEPLQLFEAVIEMYNFASIIASTRDSSGSPDIRE